MSEQNITSKSQAAIKPNANNSSATRQLMKRRSTPSVQPIHQRNLNSNPENNTSSITTCPSFDENSTFAAFHLSMKIKDKMDALRASAFDAQYNATLSGSFHQSGSSQSTHPDNDYDCLMAMHQGIERSITIVVPRIEERMMSMKTQMMKNTAQVQKSVEMLFKTETEYIRLKELHSQLSDQARYHEDEYTFSVAKKLDDYEIEATIKEAKSKKQTKSKSWNDEFVKILEDLDNLQDLTKLLGDGIQSEAYKNGTIFGKSMIEQFEKIGQLEVKRLEEEDSKDNTSLSSNYTVNSLSLLKKVREISGRIGKGYGEERSDYSSPLSMSSSIALNQNQGKRLIFEMESSGETPKKRSKK